MIHTREVKFEGSDLRADEFWVSTSPKSDDLIYRHENSINTFDTGPITRFHKTNSKEAISM